MVTPPRSWGVIRSAPPEPRAAEPLLTSALPQMQEDNQALRGALALCGLAALGMLAIVAWAYNRGLDITDEGYYLLAYQDHQPAAGGLANFDTLTKQLLGWASLGAPGYRLVHMLLVLASSLVLALGLKRFTAVNGRSPLGLAGLTAVVLVAQLGSYGFGPPTLSYNSLSSAFLLAALGLLLVHLAPADGHRSPRAQLLVPAAAGLLIGLCTFTKVNAGLGAAVVFGLALCLAPGSRDQRLRAVGGLALGGLVGVAFYFAVAQSPSDWYDAFSRDLKGSSDSQHGSGDLLSDYTQSLRNLARWIVEAVALLVGGALAWRHRNRLGRNGAIAAAVVLGVVALDLIRRRVSGGDDLQQALPLAYLFAVGTGIAAIVAGRSRIGRADLRWGLAVAVALLVPLVGAAGTNNDIIGQCILYLGAWAAAVVLVADRVPTPLRTVVTTCVLAGLAVASVARFADGYVRHPYRLGTSLFDQKVKVSVPGALDGLKLSPAAAKFVTDLDGVRRTLHTDGRQMIGMYSLPGAVLALGGTAPGESYISGLSRTRACKELVRVRPVDPMLLLVRGSPRLDCLAGAGIDFARYQRVSTVFDPYHRKPLDIYDIRRR
jgi:hypothetical protein